MPFSMSDKFTRSFVMITFPECKWPAIVITVFFKLSYQVFIYLQLHVVSIITNGARISNEFKCRKIVLIFLKCTLINIIVMNIFLLAFWNLFIYYKLRLGYFST